ncbi:MAG: hypothetical protein WBG01_09865 [Bacteroidota bacterium]
MKPEDARKQIEGEFDSARQALKRGNDGRARVCARRAAGIAIALWLQGGDATAWPPDAMNRLRFAERDLSLPEDVRNAAARLTARTTRDFASRFDTDPIEDARILVRHFLQAGRSGEP